MGEILKTGGVENPLSIKQKRLENKRKELDSVFDYNGVGIESGIKDVVALLNLLGFETNMSCEGHKTEKGVQYPYVFVHEADRPLRYVGEKEYIKSLKAEIEKGAMTEDQATKKYYEWIDFQDNETDEYKAWQLRYAVFEEKVKDLVNKYNLKNDGHRVVVKTVQGATSCEITTENFSSGKEQEKDLITAQEVFKRFKLFLEELYFSI